MAHWTCVSRAWSSTLKTRRSGFPTIRSAFACNGALGVTSIESYVTWETVEGKKEGEWDWSRWDEQVRVLKEHGLKWVPFLILGPAYSTPDWFRESSEHYGCRCLEHGIQSKVESLWNPNLPKRIDRSALLRRSPSDTARAA